jgi:hypothetical protein
LWRCGFADAACSFCFEEFTDVSQAQACERAHVAAAPTGSEQRGGEAGREEEEEEEVVRRTTRTCEVTKRREIHIAAFTILKTTTSCEIEHKIEDAESHHPGSVMRNTCPQRRQQPERERKKKIKDRTGRPFFPSSPFCHVRNHHGRGK